MNTRLPHFFLALSCVLGRLALAPAPAEAEIPEPDNVLWGVITLAGQPVTATATNIVVEARKAANGPVVASYRMGDTRRNGDAYSLRVPLEALLPLMDTNSSRVGGLVYLTVRDESGVRVARNTSIPGRGKVTRLDIVELDSDGDGLPDTWEQRYFGSATGGQPNADPDGDGRNNRDELLAGTDPTRADGRHPADASPADDAISFDEFMNYAEAWFYGDTWSTSPTNIPIAYATRAAFLWAAGESYTFTNSAPHTNAPLWWVNTLPLPGYVPGSNSVSATLPTFLAAGEMLTVSLRVTPSDNVVVHAIEDALPPGWTALSISHGGNYDDTQRKVKWGPFFDPGERELSYTAQPPADIATNATFTFTAEASFDGHNLRTPVVRTLQLRPDASGALRFTAFHTSAGLPRFALHGNAATSYLVETSTNLVDWTPLQTITTDATGSYLLAPAPASPDTTAHRFYRARTP